MKRFFTLVIWGVQIQMRFYCASIKIKNILTSRVFSENVQQQEL